MKWIEKHIETDPPKRPKKITGTRLGAILGENPWNTEFKTWCEITRTYEEPFEDTVYTAAGKVIEPKQAEYMRRFYGMSGIVSPTDVYGADYFKTTRGDFFPDNPVFGGMWDYLLKDEDGNTTAVLEMKTTKRAEDWQNDVPHYYALQAALYAWLLGVDDVYMVCSFLDEKDYADPGKFVPAAANTIVIPFKVSERYLDFRTVIRNCEQWWNNHVLTGISPDYNETADAAILKTLRTNNLNPDTDVAALITEAETLKDKLAETKPLSDRLATVEKQIKEYAINNFKDGDKTVTLPGARYKWSVTRSVSETVDKKRLKTDGLYEKYITVTESYRLTATARKN